MSTWKARLSPKDTSIRLTEVIQEEGVVVEGCCSVIGVVRIIEQALEIVDPHGVVDAEALE